MLNTEEWMRVLNMLRYVYENMSNWKGGSKHVSKLVVEFATANQENLEMATFHEMTSLDRMPYFSHKAALRLLGIEKELLEDNGPTDLSCLQKRCAHAIVSNWNQIDDLPDSVVSTLRHQTHEFVAELLVQSQQKLRVRPKRKHEIKHLEHEIKHLEKRKRSLLRKLGLREGESSPESKRSSDRESFKFLWRRKESFADEEENSSDSESSSDGESSSDSGSSSDGENSWLRFLSKRKTRGQLETARVTYSSLPTRCNRSQTAQLPELV